jgi:hypothetical protein
MIYLIIKMNNLQEELKDLYVKNGYRLDFDLMWLWINQNYISKEEILNLECLKEWEVGEKGGNRDEVGIANFVIKQIKEEIKKL